MDDLHKLSVTYKRYRDEVVNYLKDNYQALELEINPKEKYLTSLSVDLTVAEVEIDLVINIPFNYPDSFPQIKLSEASFKKVFPIPHLDTNRTLCLFDEVVASPNPGNPIGLMEAVLEKAKDTLSKGILKHNLDDFTDEFESYWLQESEKGRFLSLVEPVGNIKDVYLVVASIKEQGNLSVFADSKNDAIQWIQNIGGSYNENAISKVIYVPLKKLLSYPYPKNNKEIYHLLIDNNLCNINDYFRYLNDSQRPAKVLFSSQLEDSFVWGVWEHQEPSKQNTKLYKGKKITQRGLKGFRRGSKNGRLELLRDFSEVEIKKYYVQDVRASRLKKRGGDGELKYQSKRVVIIGCGALGSHLAQALFDLGVQDLFLIDPDTLSYENINRHLCGADQVGVNKTIAIKRKLNRHYPTSRIKTFEDDVLSLLNSYPKALNSYDLVISAISHIPTELRVNELQKQGILTSPVLDIWVEPYLTAGHGIWIEPHKSIDLNSVFQNGKFKYQVLRNGNQYSKKELGCNTSYVPYGALDLKRFINEVAFFINDQWSQEQSDSLSLTWLGNLTESRKQNRRLEPRWVGGKDFSLKFNALKNNNESVEKYDI